MRNMAVLHSPAFSYPLPVLVRVLFNLLIFKGKILYYNKYKNFLLNTLPEETRENYLNKLRVSRKFWREKGGCLSEETIAKLRAANIPIIVEECTAYHTDKKPVRMEYIDDINIPEFKEIPTYKRMCVCILKNDHTCKYMGFSQTKRERDMRKEVMDKYNFYKHGKLC